ncbi:MAG: hypothetical protein U0Q16_16790 [Bryobacteraceae bacterium]
MLHLVWSASIAANFAAALAVRLRRLPYPWFEAWLWAGAMGSVMLLLAGLPSSWTYFWAYVVIEPARWLLLAAAVHELYQRRIGGYRILSWAGSAVLWGAVLVAVIVTAISSFAGSPGQAPEIAQVLLMIRRLAHSVLLVFCLATWLFFRYYPAPSCRNVAVHGLIMLVILVGSVISTVGAWFGGTKLIDAFSVMNLICTAGCYVAWSVLLTREGEIEPEEASLERASIAEAAAAKLVDGIRDAVKTAKVGH